MKSKTVEPVFMMTYPFLRVYSNKYRMKIGRTYKYSLYECSDSNGYIVFNTDSKDELRITMGLRNIEFGGSARKYGGIYTLQLKYGT